MEEDNSSEEEFPLNEDSASIEDLNTFYKEYEENY